jgi:hypothetical protein
MIVVVAGLLAVLVVAGVIVAIVYAAREQRGEK